MRYVLYYVLYKNLYLYRDLDFSLHSTYLTIMSISPIVCALDPMLNMISTGRLLIAISKNHAVNVFRILYQYLTILRNLILLEVNLIRLTDQELRIMYFLPRTWSAIFTMQRCSDVFCITIRACDAFNDKVNLHHNIQVLQE